MKIKTERISELEDVAFNIVKQAGKRRVIVFNGEMGAGKTTLIKEICTTSSASSKCDEPKILIAVICILYPKAFAMNRKESLSPFATLSI